VRVNPKGDFESPKIIRVISMNFMKISK